jgi:ribosomal protein S27AE
MKKKFKNDEFGEANPMNVTSEVCRDCGAIVVVENDKRQSCSRCGEVPQWLKGQTR